MKKLFVSIALLGILTGCSCSTTTNLTKKTPTEAAEDYFKNYQTLNDDVLTQLETVVDKEQFTDTQKDGYRELMKKHYKDLTYEIKDEVIDGDKATVTAEIEVYDYTTTLDDADTYLSSHKDEFNDTEGNYDVTLFNEYRIKKLKEVTDKVKYTLELNLTKVDNEWKLDNLSDEDRSKINGTYKQ